MRGIDLSAAIYDEDDLENFLGDIRAEVKKAWRKDHDVDIRCEMDFIPSDDSDDEDET